MVLASTADGADQQCHAALAGRDPAATGDVSLGQKMLSAVIGSLLTSVLVTPLDVVRVRLQSQHPYQTPPPPPPHTSPSPSAPSALAARSAIRPPPFLNAPSNLGVTACCREVFWVTNTAEYCVASAAASTCAAEESRRRAFTSTFDGLRKIARNEGVLTLWRGLLPTLIMAVPANVIYFAGYDWLRAAPASPLRAPALRPYLPDAYAPLVAGSVARMLAAVVVSPIEMLRTRMQASHSHPASFSSPLSSSSSSSTTSTPARTGHFRSTVAGLRELVAARGPSALWRGFTLTLWRDVPFSAIYWWGYESGRAALRDLRRDYTASLSVSPSPSPSSSSSSSHSSSSHPARLLPLAHWSPADRAVTLVDSFLSGAASGAFAALVTTPFDVGKTRQQLARESTSSPPSSSSSTSSAAAPPPRPPPRPQQLSMPRLLWQVLQQEGFPGLFKGWTARCLKVAPACAIMISSYELGKRMAGDMTDRQP